MNLKAVILEAVINETRYYTSPFTNKGYAWKQDYGKGNTSHWSGTVAKGTLEHKGKVIGSFEHFEHPSTYSQSHMIVTHIPSGKTKQFRTSPSEIEKAKDWVLTQHGVSINES